MDGLSRRMLAGALTAAVVVAVLTALITVVVARSATPPAAAAAPSVTAPSPSPPSDPEPSPAPDPESQPTAKATPKVATSSARLEDVQTERVVPTGLSVEAIGITAAPVDAVGVEDDGSMEIPVDISRIGWYEYGPAPGDDVGSAVLTAHIDSRTQGKGVFYDLDALEPGDRVDVAMSDGTTRAFAVQETRQIPKVELPTGKIFRRDGTPRLALITCGGTFDSSSRHYRDNIVVLATPVR